MLYNHSMTHAWYHTTTLYQIYPRSFYDSNGDGVGDLPGILQKLDYLQTLGVETLWVSPFFSSPQADGGYDISDYLSIAPEQGAMEDALRLIEETHRREMRVIFDMVMNHTSAEHAWFKESRASRDNPKADWYIWRDIPNNWMSMTGGSGWHYAPERKQYYWASFLPFQPDLNYRNPAVKEAMLNAVRFWLNKGVDGFRLDIFNVIYKDAQFRNNPFSFKAMPKENDPSGFFQEYQYSLNQPESFAFAKELRQVCDEFGEKALLGEVNGSRAIIRRYLGDASANNGLGLVFDFEMLNFQFNAGYFRRMIQALESAYPDPFTPVWVFSNHDRKRSAHRLGNDINKAKILMTLQLTARGVPCLYQGEEIGMTNLPLPFKTALDPITRKYKKYPRFIFDLLGATVNRDEVRTPMQWDESLNAGFSSAAQTWLPTHPNYKTLNVQRQSHESNSLLRLTQTLLQLRKERRALRDGKLRLIENLPSSILGYERIAENETLTILINFSSAPQSLERFSHQRLVFKIDAAAVGLSGFDAAIFSPLESPSS
ncbi:MAG: alpha-glucosidase [Anaerolineales bacterium]